MKRILVITTSYFPFNGGQEIGLKRIIDTVSQKNSDYQFTILTPQYHKEHQQIEEIEGVRVHRYNSCLIRYPSKIVPGILNVMVHMLYGFMFMERYIKEINPDFVIVYFLLPSAFPAVFHLRKHQLPHLLFLGGSDVGNRNKFIKWSNKYIFRKISRIVTTSKSIQKNVMRDYNLSEDLFVNIPYGINLEDYRVAPKMWGHCVRILCVQRLVESKGTRYLIEAVDRIVKRGINNFQVDIVGDGYERERLKELVSNLDLNEVVHFYGEVKNEELPSFYERSQIFVFPTLNEGFGIVLLEAMATGNIILASNCSSIPEIITNNRNGVLFESANSIDLAEKLEEVLSGLKDYSQMALNAAQDVGQYDLSIVSDKLVRVIEEEQ